MKSLKYRLKKHEVTITVSWNLLCFRDSVCCLVSQPVTTELAASWLFMNTANPKHPVRDLIVGL